MSKQVSEAPDWRASTASIDLWAIAFFDFFVYIFIVGGCCTGCHPSLHSSSKPRTSDVVGSHRVSWRAALALIGVAGPLQHSLGNVPTGLLIVIPRSLDAF